MPSYDAEGDALTFVVVEEPKGGRLSGLDRATGEVTYAPEREAGTDSFTFAVSDGSATSAAGVVTVNLTVDNDAPVARAQEVVTDEDAAVDFTLEAE